MKLWPSRRGMLRDEAMDSLEAPRLGPHKVRRPILMAVLVGAAAMLAPPLEAVLTHTGVPAGDVDVAPLIVLGAVLSVLHFGLTPLESEQVAAFVPTVGGQREERAAGPARRPSTSRELGLPSPL